MFVASPCANYSAPQMVWCVRKYLAGNPHPEPVADSERKTYKAAAALAERLNKKTQPAAPKPGKLF